MKALFLSLWIILFSSLSANASIGTVEQLKGNVKVKNEGSIRKSKVQRGLEIAAGDLITTSKQSTAKLILADGSTLVLDERSSILFISALEAKQSEGKIFYKITSRDAKNSLKVKTPFAIIGVKGTTFIINTTDKPSVSLKEGLIGIQSLKEEFNLYRQKVQEEFENYVSKQQSDFEKYKNEQNKYAVAEPTKEFDMKQGNRISFFGQRVNEDAWSADDDAEFDHFEKLLEFMK